MKVTKFGLQPVRRHLYERRLTVAGVARELGMNYAHVANATRGKHLPSLALRRGLSELLDLPEEELFTPEVLAGEYRNPEFRALERGRHVP